MVALRIFSGVSSATFSISTPPSVEAMKTIRRVERSTTAQVQLLVDISTGFNQDLGNRLTIGVSLIGHQTLAQPLLGEGLGIFPALDQLHTTGLAAATSVNLSLDHPLGTANGVTGLGSCFRSVDSDALGDR